MNRQTILIVENDKNISAKLQIVLKKNGYQPIAVDTGEKALSIIASHCPDLILLETALSDIDGIEIIKNVRTWTYTPIIVLSERKREQDKVRALDAGADDYITKPFSVNELLARFRTAFRHYVLIEQTKLEAPINTIRVNDLEIDFWKRVVTINGRQVHLTQMEFKIVTLLAKNAGCVLTYEKLIQSIWGPYADKDTKILRVNMSNIRHKIEEDPAHPQLIITVAGIGYRMQDSI